MNSESEIDDSSGEQQMVNGPSPTDLVDHEEIKRLEEEVQSLRSQYLVGRQFRYRRMGVALGLVGIGIYLTSWFFPESREFLLIVGGTGLFTAVLVFYLTPERFVPASQSEQIFDPLLKNLQDLAYEFGLRGPTVYVPTGGHRDSGGLKDVTLFIPEDENYNLPSPNELAQRSVIRTNSKQRGLSVRPSASSLIQNFAASLSSGLASNPTHLSAQLVDGLTNSLELIGSGSEEVHTDENSVAFRISSPFYSNIDRFDNPIPSFIGTGLAAGLDSPVEVSVRESSENEIGDYVIDCEWATGDNDH